MTATARRLQAVEGRLARLVAVLAVLAGLAVTVGLQCTDVMATPMTDQARPIDAAMTCGAPMAMPAGDIDERVASADIGQLAAACLAPSAAFIAVKELSPSSNGAGGLLAACLAFILAVVAAVAALRPGRLLGVVRIRRPARLVTFAIRPPAPGLAELCVLRT